MNISKVLTVNLILFTFLSTGCSSKEVDSIKATQDEAIYQKTMTKVQNNVNEIIGKEYEYEYVLENMGHPYCTTYYIDIDKVNDINSIEEFNSIEDIRLIYPKEANVNKSKDSALYIQINNNIVKEVQTYELLSNSEKENIKSSVDIIVDIYNENYSLSSDKFENLDLNKYIEEEIELFLKDIGNVKVNFDIYDNKREKNIKVYLLNEVNSSNNKVMLVYNKLNKIEDIKIVDINNGLNLLNYYSYFK